MLFLLSLSSTGDLGMRMRWMQVDANNDIWRDYKYLQVPYFIIIDLKALFFLKQI